MVMRSPILPGKGVGRTGAQLGQPRPRLLGEDKACESPGLLILGSLAQRDLLDPCTYGRFTVYEGARLNRSPGCVYEHRKCRCLQTTPYCSE